MKNESNTYSKRYYIFKHIPGSVEETVKYRDPTGTWYTDFNKANLWADYDFTVKKAKELKAQLRGCEATQEYNVCIGMVNVEVDGFFPIIVA